MCKLVTGFRTKKVSTFFRTSQRETHAKSKHICNSHKPTHSPKIAKELALPTQTKIVFKKFPNASKK